jgi:hypothetical protein
LKGSGGEEEGAADVRGKVGTEIVKAVGSSEGAVFPIVSLVHDEKGKIALDASHGGQAVDIDELVPNAVEVVLSIVKEWSRD